MSFYTNNSGSFLLLQALAKVFDATTYLGPPKDLAFTGQLAMQAVHMIHLCLSVFFGVSLLIACTGQTSTQVLHFVQFLSASGAMDGFI